MRASVSFLSFLQFPASFHRKVVDDALLPVIAMHIGRGADALPNVLVVILLFTALYAVADIEFLADRHYLFLGMVFAIHSITAGRGVFSLVSFLIRIPSSRLLSVPL